VLQTAVVLQPSLEASAPAEVDRSKTLAKGVTGGRNGVVRTWTTKTRRLTNATMTGRTALVCVA